MKDRKMSFYNRIVKRMLDIICSLAAIVCLSVLYLPICAIIKCTSEGPVFFRQKRIGKNKKYFNILKFRTMRIDTPKDCPTHLLKNPEQYITKVGAFLRKTSLDELPQIFNIFKGDMSVIGPRPALWNQDDLVAERDKYGANDVRPGLTLVGRRLMEEMSFQYRSRQNLMVNMLKKLVFGLMLNAFL